MLLVPSRKKVFKSSFWSFLFRSYFQLDYMLFSDNKYAEKRYRKVYCRDLQIEDPKYFHEKLQWIKLHDRREIYTQCADKLAVRDYVKMVVGEKYLIPLLGVYENADELISARLPNQQLILKCNHNSGAYTIVKNKNEIDWPVQRKIFKNLLKQNYYCQGREWQYKNIKPQIIAEQLLMNEDGSIPYDFKFFCLNSKVELIQVDLDREDNHTRNLYDTNWNLLPLKYCYPNGKTVSKPTLLNEMIGLAEKLSKPFHFARIDFYNCRGKIFFGEITFHPEGGFGTFDKLEFELQLGRKLKLNINKV